MDHDGQGDVAIRLDMLKEAEINLKNFISTLDDLVNDMESRIRDLERNSSCNNDSY